MQDAFREAAHTIAGAKAVVITAGAGVGVDSGLPDFRGDHGFWKAYPMYQRLGINFIGAANPAHFERDPSFGWGFYGHRTNLYRETVPHPGFALLQQWITRYGLFHFVVTSNVDGQFQKAGYADNAILEVHGSIHHLQCLKPCTMDIWPNREEIPIDFDTMRAQHLPLCRRCGGVARPNVLMFGDYSWIPDRTQRQEDNFDAFLDQVGDSPVAVVEIGAGTMVPTIRYLSERLGQRPHARVIRINPREAHIEAPHISLSCTGLAGLEGIDSALNKL